MSQARCEDAVRALSAEVRRAARDAEATERRLDGVERQGSSHSKGIRVIADALAAMDRRLKALEDVFSGRAG